MPRLRITQETLAEDAYRARLQLEDEGSGRAATTATVDFHFTLTDSDRADLRWYLEEYLQFPFDPAPAIARRIEERLTALGHELFRLLFEENREARRLYDRLYEQLAETRVEVITEVAEAATIPWELLADPTLETPLALRARAFVRTYDNPAQRAVLPQAATGEAIRILLVICRPRGDDDVPFRSVAARLLQGLTAATRQQYQLDVLRPPTFAQLARVLRAAKEAGKPYHILHFDGHGTYTAVAQDGKFTEALGALLANVSSVVLGALRGGKHGFLLFENPDHQENLELIDGVRLGQLLVETQVPVLVLNACQSAQAEPPPSLPQGGGTETAQPPPSLPQGGGSETARAYGSLAQEVMRAGVAGVVAMRYNIYVVTAAQFVADLYAALCRGQALGEAVTYGRKLLHDEPARHLYDEPLALQDWQVPVVFEAAPVLLFPRLTPLAAAPVTLQVGTTSATPDDHYLDPALPPTPDAGFFGRDETLLALDRAFDTQKVVLLHAYAGAGKTSTAAEFARWYSQTGGVRGPVLFTAFEQYLPLPRVLDKLGALFEQTLEQNGIQWLALEDAKRKDVALQIMHQVPILWIWDNVEGVAGFPAGTPSLWSAGEQRALADFLRAARATQAKFLLTSRRTEEGWLGGLPMRIAMPPMPMPERIQLAGALLAKAGRRLQPLAAWRPLLRFSDGNPLTLTVLVGQAIRERLQDGVQLNALIERVRSGAVDLGAATPTPSTEDAAQGRATSLAASLAYGFEHAFTAAERPILALLHLFQGFVDVDALVYMGNEKLEWHLPKLRGLDRARAIALLDRAAEIGLLDALGHGYYRIHPALPWYFHTLYMQCYPDTPPPNLPRGGGTDDGDRDSSPLGEAGRGLGPLRAFTEALGALSTYYFDQYEDGNRDVITFLRLEEANLLHARALARRHGWYSRIISTMQGLIHLYNHTGRHSEWARLVQEIVPDFVDPANDGPLPGRETDWNLVTYYRARLAQEARQWGEAERLQRILIDWNRQLAATALAVPPAALTSSQRNAIRSLAVSLEQLGHIQRKQSETTCAASYQEAIPLCQTINDKPEEAIISFNLGHAYKDIPALRDLDTAERWYRHSLELRAEKDRKGRAMNTGQLGGVAYERFNDARTAKADDAILLEHLNAALAAYQQALDLLPSDAVDDLAVIHNQMGNIFKAAGDVEQAVTHYSQSIRYEELQGNLYGAGQTRCNVAILFYEQGRLADARAYALAALRNFEPYGAGAAADIEDTQRLLADIDRAG